MGHQRHEDKPQMPTRRFEKIDASSGIIGDLVGCNSGRPLASRAFTPSIGVLE
jgi:hypothetical protein